MRNLRSIVPIIGESDIDESYIRQRDVAVLKTLQIDRTMTVEVRVKPCEGCDKGDVKKHNGIRCRVMDWAIGKQVFFMPPFEFKTIEG